MQYLGNSIYLKCFLLLLLFRLVPSVEALIEAWATCMISLHQGCMRKSDSASSNNGTSHLSSGTWLQQEPCKFPAIRLWQVAGNQYNIPPVPCCILGEKMSVQCPECGWFGAQAAPQALWGHRWVSALLGRPQKATRWYGGTSTGTFSLCTSRWVTGSF